MSYIQYNNATNLNNLLYGNENYPGLKQILKLNVDDFYNNYFNIDTCNHEGLNNWGKLLDIPNSYKIGNYNDVFGFGDKMGLPPVDQKPYNYPQNFMHGNFYNGKFNFITLLDEEYRRLIKLKYRILVSNFSYNDIIDILNQFIQSININYKFRLVQIDTKNISYQFNFIFSPTEYIYYSIIRDSYLLPVPMGVEYTIIFKAGLF